MLSDQPVECMMQQRKIKSMSFNFNSNDRTMDLPSNLLQQRPNILRQFKSYHSAQQSRRSTGRQKIFKINQTFSQDPGKIFQQNNLKDKFQTIMKEQNNLKNSPIKREKQKQKKLKNPLYRRLTNIQAQNPQLSGVSFSKLLSRMLVFNDSEMENSRENHYQSQLRTKKHYHMQTTLKSIPHYQCLQSKMFTVTQFNRSKQIDSPSSSPQRHREPTSNRIFRKYFNPHGQKHDSKKSSETVNFDERYIYRNGKKTECKRIHNFYTSHMYRKNYQKHMRNTIDGFYSSKKGKFFDD